MLPRVTGTLASNGFYEYKQTVNSGKLDFDVTVQHRRLPSHGKIAFCDTNNKTHTLCNFESQAGRSIYIQWSKD